jgi:N-acetylneuraminic acid mutarotase
MVLVVGGTDENYSLLDSALLYDPVSNSWNPAGTLTDARSNHSATLLDNGQVLVTGGYGSSGTLVSAELYDPATNTWIVEKNSAMPNPHAMHTATLLADGRVLVAGGFDIDSGTITALDVYNPDDNSWAAIAQMDEDRISHTATLLLDGRVLIVGGGFQNSARIFDPDQENPFWTPAGAMTSNRMRHTATLLNNGSVLVSGGQDSSSAAYLANAEIYHPDTDSWGPAGNMAAVRVSHNATLLADGTVVVTGGYSDYTMAQGFAELFDPVTESWAVAGLMSLPTSGHVTALLPDGNALESGGNDGTHPVAASEMFRYGTFNIKTAAGSGGSITQSQTVVRSIDSTPVIITPDAGYLIAIVLIDGKNQTISDRQQFSFTFQAVTANHTITATFVKIWQLDVSLNSTAGGSGSVTVGGNYVCYSNPCFSLTYEDGSHVSLHELSDSDSFFTGWNITACGVSQTCEVIMDGPRSVIASFDRLTLVKSDLKNPPFYGLLSNAYKEADSGNIIKAQAIQFEENLSFNLPVQVYIDGGYDQEFLNKPGQTVVHGTMKINSGRISVRRVSIR